MTAIKQLGGFIAGIVVTLLVSGILLAMQKHSEDLGGVYNNNTKDFSEGLTVDGNRVIDGNGVVNTATSTYKIGNVQQWTERDDATAATTTVCAYQGPSIGTTTVDFTFNVIGATSTAIAGTLSYGTYNATQPSASGTLIANTAGLAASTKGVIRNASSTPLGPNQWMVYTLQGADPFRLSSAYCVWTAKAAS